MQLAGWLNRTLILTLAPMFLLGCKTEAPDASVKPADPIIVVHCGTNANLSADDKKRAAVELSQLPESSVIGNKIVPDWSRMRDENTACEKDNSNPLPSPPAAPAPTS